MKIIEIVRPQPTYLFFFFFLFFPFFLNSRFSDLSLTLDQKAIPTNIGLNLTEDQEHLHHSNNHEVLNK